MDSTTNSDSPQPCAPQIANVSALSIRDAAFHAEQRRIKALNEAFPDRPAFVFEAIKRRWTIEQAAKEAKRDQARDGAT
jgi:hypothetical protein